MYMFLASAFFFDNFLSFQVLNHDPVEGANNCEMTPFFSFFLIFFGFDFWVPPFASPELTDHVFWHRRFSIFQQGSEANSGSPVVAFLEQNNLKCDKWQVVCPS